MSFEFYASELRPPERPSWKCKLFGCDWKWSHVRGDSGEAAMDLCTRCGAMRPNFGFKGPCRCLPVWVFAHYNGRPGVWGGVDCRKKLCQCEFSGVAAPG